MTDSSRTPQSSHFFLPKLKDRGGSQEGIDIKPGPVGNWDQQSNVAFQHVASSLEVPSAGRDIKSVSSIPDMWARPLSMEMALYNRKYPIRTQMIEQWQGMLAAIALAEVRGFNLKAERVELKPLKENGDAFARSLYELLPSTHSCFYTLDGQNPWQELYVFLWNGRSVGMTSPSTLVCPAEDANWSGLPWWEDGRLRSPVQTDHYLSRDEKIQLKQWLETLCQDINRQNGRTEAINELISQIRTFQISLGDLPGQPLKRSPNERFFGVNVLGALKSLSIPIQAIAQESSVRLIPSTGKTPTLDVLLIPDPQKILREWNVPAQSIWIHETTHLASLKPEDIPRSGELARWKVRCLREADVFLPEFFFIVQANALPGGLLPKGMNDLTEIYEGKSITPLLPINPMLLEAFTPEDLSNLLQVTRVETTMGPQIQFALDLPLSGVKRDEGSMTYRLAKVYALKPENSLSEVPVLEVWPNFSSPTWKEYYAFYYDPNLETFGVQFSAAQENYTFKGVGSFHYPNYSFPDTESNCQIVQLSEFPTFLDCSGKAQPSMGLILLKTPKKVGTATGIPWKVGVDFGTSFTNLYVKRNGIVEPLSLEPLHYKVTESSVEIRQTALYEYFIASNMELPLSTVLTTRGGKGETFPVLDGRIYIPRDSTTFKPNTDDWIWPNLKWSPDNLNYNRLFLKHLVLQITAQAMANSVKEVQWALSYPSAFSKTDRNTYVRNWRNLTVAIEETTGVTQICPSLDNLQYYRTESLAIAQYFADFEVPGRKTALDLVNSTCIDIGGGTSDISIWEENKLVHQCSVQLAGKDLFSQFIQINPGFLERQFKITTDEWRKLQGFQFYVKLDVFMRRESEGWLRNRRDIVADEPEFQGLLNLMALGIAGLYYYVGLLLKALSAEGKYKTPEITPVFLGGNGSRLLNWLAEGGEFSRHCEANAIFSAILSNASGFEDIGVNTVLSPLPKDEVACGLVLEESHLMGLDKREEDCLIAGEAFTISGQDFDWHSRMQIGGIIEDFTVPQMTQLTQFLNSFHRILAEQRIEGLSPFKGYQISADPTANGDLWRATARELKKTLLRLRGNADDVRIEPPFILGLKALLQVLGNRWADEWK